MADPNRPPAPFLPPEIVTQIIDSTPSKYHPRIARINSSWTNQVQVRIFKWISIHRVGQLRRLVPILESQNRLAQMIKHACIEVKTGWSGPTKPFSRGKEEAKLVFRLLSTMKNLESLKFKASEYEFSDEQRSIFFSQALLPSLVTLELENIFPDWSGEVFECIVATAPNIETFTFENNVPDMSEPDSPGGSWNAYPKKIKKLYSSDGSDLSWFMDGEIIPVGSFKNLEELGVVDYTLWIEERDDFFRMVAPTLKCLQFGNVEEIEGRSFSSGLKKMAALEKIEGLLMPDYPKFFKKLPSNVKFLSIYPGRNSESLKIALETYYTSSKNHLSFTHFEINFNGGFELNLAHIPTTQKLVLDYTDAFQPGLDALKVGEAKFEELVLRKEYCEDEAIKRRCDELGITLSAKEEKGVAPDSKSKSTCPICHSIALWLG